MKILHLISDHQVVERTLSIFEDIFPDKNEVLIFSDKADLKHIVKYKESSIVNRRNYKRIIDEFDFSEITYVVAHYLSFEKIDFIKCIPQQIHVCWDMYGGDFYNQFLHVMGYDLYYSNPIKYSKYYYLKRFFPSLLKMLLYIKGNRPVYERIIKKQFNYISHRINSLSVCCSGEVALFKQYSGVEPPCLEIFKYSLKETLGDLYGSDFSKGDDILIGNSASFTNNHLYAFQQLKGIDINKSNLVIPISYGGIPKYVSEIKMVYTEKYPQNVKFISRYMPLREYNKMFMNMKIMILSSWRQESVGTIIMGLYLGIKIYLSRKNPLYDWLLSLGCKIYCMEELATDDFNIPLKNPEKENNRGIILKHYSDENVRSNIRNHFK